MFTLREREVNVGRQRERDLVKGLLMIMIILHHPKFRLDERILPFSVEALYEIIRKFER